MQIKLTKRIIFSTMLITIMLSGILISAKPMKSREIQTEYVLDVENVYSHLWSPDGMNIAYTTCPTGQNWNCELWITDYNLQNSKLILTGVDGSNLHDWYGDWILLKLRPTNPAELTPDGKAIAGELWKIKSDGTDLTRVTSTYTNGLRIYFWNPSWGLAGTVGWAKFIPDTNLIYFSAHRGNGWWAPHTTTADGNDIWKRVHYQYSFTIGMAPSGDKLLWGSSHYWNQPTTLYSANNDGTGIFLIKSFPVKTSPLVLLDDYTVILNWPGGDIHAINMDSSQERIIIQDAYHNYWLNYHTLQDKAFLMRSDRADSNNHIFKVSSDTLELLQLTDGDYMDNSAQYSPDGKYILYNRLPVDFNPTSGDPYPYQLVVKDIIPVELNNLMERVSYLYDEDSLNKGQAHSLMVKLEHVMKHYMIVGHLHTASNILQAFVNQVYDFIENEVLTNDQGQILINHANLILDMMN